jgi:hypothetical protein
MEKENRPKMFIAATSNCNEQISVTKWIHLHTKNTRVYRYIGTNAGKIRAGIGQTDTEPILFGKSYVVTAASTNNQATCQSWHERGALMSRTKAIFMYN